MCNFRNVDETLCFVIKCNKCTVRLNSCYFTFYCLTSFILYCHAEQLLYKFRLFHTIKHYNMDMSIEQKTKTVTVFYEKQSLFDRCFYSNDFLISLYTAFQIDGFSLNSFAVALIISLNFSSYAESSLDGK